MTSSETPHDYVLLVDDDPGIRDVVGEFLILHGYDVDTAGDGREMERAIERRRPDLVVLDLMLPGEDGLALCQRLRKPGGPSIIMLSPMGEETDRIVGLELGADDYLPKPCNPRELLARVRAVLRRRREPADGGDGLGVACEFADGDMAVIEVEDAGPGLPDADMERAFEPFHRLEGSRSRATGGIGLGLAIARAVARGHGGDVTLSNPSGGGLIARIALPVAVAS